MAVRITYDETLAHRIMAGADLLLIPSRFEPCDLTQMYALRYGTVPVVARTGGLADTVVDATNEELAQDRATGLLFEPGSVSTMLHALERARQHLRAGTVRDQEIAPTQVARMLDLAFIDRLELAEAARGTRPKSKAHALDHGRAMDCDQRLRSRSSPTSVSSSGKVPVRCFE